MGREEREWEEENLCQVCSEPHEDCGCLKCYDCSESIWVGTGHYGEDAAEYEVCTECSHNICFNCSQEHSDQHNEKDEEKSLQT